MFPSDIAHSKRHDYNKLSRFTGGRVINNIIITDSQERIGINLHSVNDILPVYHILFYFQTSISLKFLI